MKKKLLALICTVIMVISMAGCQKEFDATGYAIGGLSVGEPKEIMNDFVEYTANLLPQNKPRYLMGVGTPEDLLDGIKRGIDMFDCVLPSRNARHGTAFTSYGKIQVKSVKYRESHEPLDPKCNCKVCKTYTMGYLNHLIKSEEILGMRMLTYHNLYFLITNII